MTVYYVYGCYSGVEQEFLIGEFLEVEDALRAMRNAVTKYADVWIRKREVKVGLTK